MPEPSIVLCAGDRFITSASLAAAAVREFGPATRTRRYDAGWPDEPFTSADGVREAAGDSSELVERATAVTVVLTHLAPVTAALFEAAPGLRVVGVTRGGPVNVDLDAATAHGVPVIHLPGRNLDAVAEFTIGAMIALTRNIGIGSRELAGGRWDARYYRFERTGPQLGASTVGVVGLGAVGTRVAQLLRGFGSRVLAYDPFVDADTAGAAGVELCALERLLADSDIVSVHARLGPQTVGMFDADSFAAMKPGARLVNTARGELVDRVALLAALESGRLGGAALDVFDPEPPDPSDPLLARSDVIVTPHLAGASRQVALESVAEIARLVAVFLRDGVLTRCANPQWSAVAGSTAPRPG